MYKWNEDKGGLEQEDGEINRKKQCKKPVSATTDIGLTTDGGGNEKLTINENNDAVLRKTWQYEDKRHTETEQSRKNGREDGDRLERKLKRGNERK